MKKLLLIFCLALLLSGCGDVSPEVVPTAIETVILPTATPTETSSVEVTPTPEATSTVAPTLIPRERPRIILFIGDGMGAEHRLAAQFYSVGEIRLLNMDKLPVFGWLEPDPYGDGDELPESASAATALATGTKTFTEVVSLDIDGNQVKTILEYAQDLGMSVGLISNKYITDSTTAAFSAHVEDSGMRLDIATQILAHRVDVIFGGGENDFLPKGVAGCHPEMGNRVDGRNLIEEAEEQGYSIVCDERSFGALDPQVDSRVIGFFADENMPRPYTPSLAEMTRTAIEILSVNPNGYFLVVEGAMIDIASHYQESLNMMNDVVEFDQAVEAAMTYAEVDENTLVIVTADHETGGLVVGLTSSGYDNEDGPFYMPNTSEFFVSWHTAVHTHSNVPVSAYGPVSEKLRGHHENTVVFDVMLEFLGIAKTGE